MQDFDNGTFEKEAVAPDAISSMQYGPALTMKWHNFLIWFLLWANAALNLVSGLVYLLAPETLYGVDAGRVYSMWPSLRSVDVFFAVISFVMAAYCVVTRFALAQRRYAAPMMLLIMYGVNIGMGIAQPFLQSVCTELSFMDLFSIGKNLFRKTGLSNEIIPQNCRNHIVLYLQRSETGKKHIPHPQLIALPRIPFDEKFFFQKSIFTSFRRKTHDIITVCEFGRKFDSLMEDQKLFISAADLCG